MTVDADPLAQSVVVAYGSTFGTTEETARQIADALAARTGRRPTLADVAWTGMAEIVRHDVLILGSSTWDEGELQPAWDVALSALSASDLRGRRVAVFGCGDRAGYPDTFGDALGILLRHARGAGAESIGAFPMDRLGYDPGTFEAEEVRDGDDLVGLIVDDEEDDDARVAQVAWWCDLLTSEWRHAP
ncbi:MAG: flavodoxin domain-containing protein [Trueperaceae bacterium]|nr:flavodoxin domain-containing protein [Trueperaceae bacterium]